MNYFLRSVAGFSALLSIAALAFAFHTMPRSGADISQLAASEGANSGAVSLRAGAVSPDSFSLITEPQDGIVPVLLMLEGATKSIDLVMYQLEDSQIEEALAAARARGILVRVLLNGGYRGAPSKDNEAAYQYLQAHTVPVRHTPAYFALTHQKTLVVDGNDALIMTFNLTPKYYATSRDFAVADRDPNDVLAIEQTFNADWQGSRIDAPQGDDLLWSPGSENEMLSLIASAASSIEIYNEEMADGAVIDALERAAVRGVRVRVDMSYATNWKIAFQQLAAAGVSVRTYASSSKSFYIHAKVIIADDAVAFIGSENFSQGSLGDNRELGIILSAPAVIQSLTAVFSADWAKARPFINSSP